VATIEMSRMKKHLITTFKSEGETWSANYSGPLHITGFSNGEGYDFIGFHMSASNKMIDSNPDRRLLLDIEEAEELVLTLEYHIARLKNEIPDVLDTPKPLR
jgi:hypothetical protein